MSDLEHKELERVNTRLTKVEEDLTEVKEGVKDIKRAILGDEFNPDASFKARLERVESFVEGLRGHMAMAKAWGVVIGSLVSFGGLLIFKIIENWHPISNLIKGK